MENITVNLENLKTAYSYKSTSELKLTHFVFKTLQKPNLLKLLKSVASGIIKYNLPFKFLIKKLNKSNS